MATPGVVLSIGAADPTGASGTQADLMTFAAHRLYGVSVVTAIATHTAHGVDDLYPVPASVVGNQLSALLSDVPVAAVKVGMLATAEIGAAVAAKARAGALPNLVLDPVMSAGRGSRLGVTAAVKRLLPYATVITPDLDEASALLGWPVITTADMAGAAGQLAAEGARFVVVTGGSAPSGSVPGASGPGGSGPGGSGPGGDAVDAMWTPSGARMLRAPRIATRNGHGTGCAFSAAVAARLALGDPVPDALARAKDYVGWALQGSVGWRWGRTGAGGPVNHLGL